MKRISFHFFSLLQQIDKELTQQIAKGKEQFNMNLNESTEEEIQEYLDAIRAKFTKTAASAKEQRERLDGDGFAAAYCQLHQQRRAESGEAVGVGWPERNHRRPQGK